MTAIKIGRRKSYKYRVVAYTLDLMPRYNYIIVLTKPEKSSAPSYYNSQDLAVADVELKVAGMA